MSRHLRKITNKIYDKLTQAVTRKHCTTPRHRLQALFSKSLEKIWTCKIQLVEIFDQLNFLFRKFNQQIHGVGVAKT